MLQHSTLPRQPQHTQLRSSSKVVLSQSRKRGLPTALQLHTTLQPFHSPHDRHPGIQLDLHHTAVTHFRTGLLLSNAPEPAHPAKATLSCMCAGMPYPRASHEHPKHTRVGVPHAGCLQNAQQITVAMDKRLRATLTQKSASMASSLCRSALYRPSLFSGHLRWLVLCMRGIAIAASDGCR